MKKLNRENIIIVAGFIVTIVISALFYNTMNKNEEKRRNVESLILDFTTLTKTNSQINQEILKAYRSEHYNYDSLASGQKELKLAMGQNKNLGLNAKLKNLVKDKIETVNTFKMKNAIFRNSRFYLAKLASEVNNYKNKNILVHQTLLELNQYFIRDAFNSSIIQELETLSQKVKTYPKNEEIINRINMHLNLLTKGKKELVEIINRFPGELEKALSSNLEQSKKSLIIITDKTREIRNLLFLTNFFLILIILIFVKKVLKFNKNLEFEVASKTKDLVKANELAQESLKIKSSFLANMSHEIRTPLNGIIGCTNILLDNSKKLENVKLLKTVIACGDTLLTLINDILDFSKLESKKMELENRPFNLLAQVKQIIHLFNSKASEKSLIISNKFNNEVPIWVNGDTTRFGQVLSNLISNAIKFSENGEIAVETNLLEERSNACNIQFSVKDQGIGISENGVSKLFKSFSQIDASTTKKFGGTGLGLAISKSLVELMGGEIWVTSQKGEGSTFFFTIKVLRATPQHEGRSMGTDNKIDSNLAKSYPLKILLADDNRVNQLVGKKLLEKLGYRVDVAADGSEVLTMLTEHKYDLIFMDCHMPEIDGFEATKSIIEQYKENRPKIVALTASAMKEDREKCLSVGMDDFISKPIQIEQVIRVIKSCHDNHSSVPPEKSSLAVDEKALMAQFGGDVEVLSEIAHEFIKKAPEYLNEIEDAISTKNSKKLEATAHTIKGASSNFHAKEVVDISQKLEFLGRDNSFAESEEIFQELKVGIDDLNKTLETLCTKKIA